MSMYSLLYKRKKGTEQLNYGRHILSNWTEEYVQNNNITKLKVLDLGAGSGIDLLNIKKSAHICCELYAVESYPPNIEILEQNGIKCFAANIEQTALPFPDRTFDIVIMNQILEHTKEIFWIFSEVSRILKTGGECFVGVPNLASLHNRILLLFGRQPSSIRMLGPHVRGITKNDFISFIETDGYFNTTGFAGSNFYPFREKAAKLVCKIFPTGAVSIFFRIVRTDKQNCFIHVLDERFFETPWYRGNKEKE